MEIIGECLALNHGKIGEHGECLALYHGEIREHGECLALYHGKNLRTMAKIEDRGKIWRSWLDYDLGGSLSNSLGGSTARAA